MVDYSGKWAKKEGVDDSALSEWVKVIRHLVKRCVYFVRNSISTRSKAVFENKEIAAKLADIHDKYALVAADKVSNNVVLSAKHIVSNV